MDPDDEHDGPPFKIVRHISDPPRLAPETIARLIAEGEVAADAYMERTAPMVRRERP